MRFDDSSADSSRSMTVFSRAVASTLADVLRQLRMRAGLSQRDAGDRSGVGEKTISSFETGKRIDGISVAQLFALLKAYDTSLETFVDSLRSERIRRAS